MKNKNQWDAEQLIQFSGNYWGSFALHAAVKLDVFTAIGDKELSGKEIARALNAEPRAMSMLLNAITALGLLKKNTDQYSNTPVSRKFLSKDSEDYVGYIIMHHHNLADSWARLDLAVKTGEPTRTRTSFGDETVRKNFLMGMFNLAMNLAPRLAPHIDLAGRRRLLDLGGGPGTYAIQFCRNNPQLQAAVFDLPTTQSFAEDTIGKFKLSDRIRFISGDFVNDDIPGKYDVVWLSHILHGESPQNCHKILQKALLVLEPGGMIIIHEFILNNTMDGPLHPALFSLNMLLGARGGQSYSEGQLMDMLKRVGVKQIRRIPLGEYDASGIITGVK